MSEEKKTNFTEEQIKAIESVGRTIVSASAGSGKTTVMIERIIRLIEKGEKVSGILAVTFTKKAAAQMKEKLCKAIIKTINKPETTLERRKELKKELAEVSGADISTIHSFCAKLIRTNFYAAGVDNAFRVIGDEDAEGTALKNRALDMLLEEGYEEKDERFAHLLSVYWRKKSDNNLRKILSETYKSLRSRSDYKEYLEQCQNYDERVFENICRDLHERVVKKCEYYIECLRPIIGWFEARKAKSATLCEQVFCALDAVTRTADYFEACALEKPQFQRKEATTKASDEYILQVERLALLKDKTAEIYEKEFAQTGTREEELAAFLRSGKTAAAMADMLLKFDERYSQLKAERGVLDYNDLEHKALELLQNEDVVNELREKYRYVFVDEYQDVNPVQEAIVNRISGENLFLVGDVKQSIYGFRGSKSVYFTQKRKQFDEEGGANLLLTRNFRSSDEVLDAVNKQFELAMTPRNAGLDYKHDSYMEKSGRYGEHLGRVRIHYLDPDYTPGKKKKKEKTEEVRGVYSVRNNAEKFQSEETENAKLIRRIIQEERNKKWFDADEGVEKRVEYSDIAVLTRKKSGKITDTIAALLNVGVPVSTASEVNICEYSEIKTLIDILSLIDNAEQDIPLCGALLSSMGDMSPDELTAIRIAYKDERYFRNACKQYALEKTDLIAHKLKKFYAYYDTLRTLSSVMDAGELLTKFVAETRMEARLLSHESRKACLRRIHRFIEESTAEEPLSVHEFLDKLRDMDYKIMCCENGGENSVKVVTMHSSKGLEYPVVILDNLSASFRHTERDDVFTEEQYGLAPRAFDEAKLLRRDTLHRRLHKYRELDSSLADELNLYYVALTRAKYALHMLFDHENLMPDVRFAKSFADFTDFSVWEEYVDREAYIEPSKNVEREALVFAPNEALAQEIKRAFTWEYAHTGYENLPVKSSATSLMTKQDKPEPTDEPFQTAGEEKIPEAYEGKGETSIEAGLAYHAFLENFDFGQLFDENGDRVSVTRLESIVEKAYENTEDTTLISKEKLVEILSNPVFGELRGMRLYKEKQFLVSLPVKDTYALKEGVDPLLREKGEEEMLFQGAIDLLAVGDEEARIIDYKYSVRSAESLKEHYKKQLDLYRLAVAKILKKPLENVRCSIVNIYRGFQVDM
ncbi:MAG: UvrD-helicase domain-containing protein [Clostridia bacterium]|nr:UvrD-helicase domain-containing protein [Clostridia bacterium]